MGGVVSLAKFAQPDEYVYFLSLKYSIRIFFMVVISRSNEWLPSVNSSRVPSSSASDGRFSAGGRLPRCHPTRQPGEQNRGILPLLVGLTISGFPQDSHLVRLDRSVFFLEFVIVKNVTYVTKMNQC